MYEERHKKEDDKLLGLISSISPILELFILEVDDYVDLRVKERTLSTDTIPIVTCEACHSSSGMQY